MTQHSYVPSQENHWTTHVFHVSATIKQANLLTKHNYSRGNSNAIHWIALKLSLAVKPNKYNNGLIWFGLIWLIEFDWFRNQTHKMFGVQFGSITQLNWTQSMDWVWLSSISKCSILYARKYWWNEMHDEILSVQNYLSLNFENNFFFELPIKFFGALFKAYYLYFHSLLLLSTG